MSSVFSQGGRGHWPVYFTRPQSFIIPNVFLIRWLNKFGNLINFDWLVFDIECSNVSTTEEGLIVCIVIGDVHQFIRHCLIPLDP